LRIGVFYGLAGIDALAADWRALFDQLDRPGYVHLWEWHRCYLESELFDPESALFCAAYDGDRLMAVLPLLREVKSLLGVPVRLLVLPLNSHTPHADIIADPRAQADLDLPRILHLLRTDLGEPWDVVRLGLTLEDSILNAAMREMRNSGRNLLTMTYQESTSNAIKIAPYDEMFARFSRNFRGSLRNARNRLAKLEGVEFRVARSPAELEEAFPRFLAVEASGWKGKAGTAIQCDSRHQAFYSGYVKHLGPKGRCRIDLLMHGKRVMAGQLALVVGDRLYSFKIGYDESYKREAPGTLLQERVLQELAEDPHIRYMDLISNQKAQQHWRPLHRRVFMHYLCRAAPRGALFWVAMRTRHAWRFATGKAS